MTQLHALCCLYSLFSLSCHCERTSCSDTVLMLNADGFLSFLKAAVCCVWHCTMPSRALWGRDGCGQGLPTSNLSCRLTACICWQSTGVRRRAWHGICHICTTAARWVGYCNWLSYLLQKQYNISTHAFWNQNSHWILSLGDTVELCIPMFVQTEELLAVRGVKV